MKLSILLHTSVFQGDRSDNVVIAHELRPGETVEELAARLLNSEYEEIEIRRVVEPIGEQS